MSIVKEKKPEKTLVEEAKTEGIQMGKQKKEGKTNDEIEIKKRANMNIAKEAHNSTVRGE